MRSWFGGGPTRRRVLSVAVTAAAAATLAATAAGAPRPDVLRAGSPAGIVFARGSGHGPAKGSTSPDLLYHGGPVMSSGAAAVPIFWGSSWGTSAGDKVSGLDAFYSGVGGSSYLDTTTEYTDSGGSVSDRVVYSPGGYLFDGARAPAKAPSTSAVATVVADTLTAAGKQAVPNGYYPVYSDQPRGHASYCAWHSWGQIDTGNGPVEVQFAFFFNLDNDPACTPQTNYDETGHSEGLRALANVSGHELSEALTDPNGNAWYDRQGEENADKCAWTFSGNLLSFGGSSWEIQGNWSNAVYDAGGSASYLGPGSGCIDAK